jgi:hypothetical protein
MKIHVDPSSLRQTTWYEYAIRFLFGGLVAVATGMIAKEFGPAVGGLFLAFPAIFPASATLVEKHEKEKKEKLGMNGTVRARKATSIDAAGASMGSIGLLAFALLASQLLGRHAPWAVLLAAVSSWMAVSYLAWVIRKRGLRLLRRF